MFKKLFECFGLDTKTLNLEDINHDKIFAAAVTSVFTSEGMFGVSFISVLKSTFVCFCLLVGAVLYRKLKAYLMSEEELQEHGYPRLNPEASGKAVIHNLPEKKIILDREQLLVSTHDAIYTNINLHYSPAALNSS